MREKEFKQETQESIKKVAHIGIKLGRLMLDIFNIKVNFLSLVR